MYTVDEHSLRAVENAIAFENESSVVGKTYRKIKDKNLLHLALLLHDLGKGFPEDHSIVGERIAEETGVRLDLPEEDIETIKFLVRHHLLMSHIAMHRDINDLELIAEFASKLGSVNILNMLFVLTCADISAVGPEVLNPWKLQLLTELFHRCTEILAGDGDADPTSSSNQHLEDMCRRVSDQGQDEESKRWLLKATRNLPNNYLQSHTAEDIVMRFLPIRDLQEGKPACWIEYDEGPSIYRICLANLDRRRSGNFYRLTGLSSHFLDPSCFLDFSFKTPNMAKANSQSGGPMKLSRKPSRS